MARTFNLLTNLFPIWVTACCLAALGYPPAFAWFTKLIVPALGVIMLGMGITLKVDDFAQVLRLPWPVLLGVLAQFTIMPLLGWSIANGFHLPNELAVGVILVSCCPGGTASNVVTYIARANLALSVLMTMCSTFAAIALTPLLTEWLVGTRMEVDAVAMFCSTVQVVLLPVLAGLALHHLLPRAVHRITPFAPLISVVAIALICANIIGRNRDLVLEHAGQLTLAIATLHAAGFVLGYALTRLLRFDELTARTVSIEVGMQNSGLGTVLATRHFTNPATQLCLPAVPCALSAVAHSLIGSLIAVAWRRRLATTETPAEPSAGSD